MLLKARMRESPQECFHAMKWAFFEEISVFCTSKPNFFDRSKSFSYLCRRFNARVRVKH